MPNQPCPAVAAVEGAVGAQDAGDRRLVAFPRVAQRYELHAEDGSAESRQQGGIELWPWTRAHGNALALHQGGDVRLGPQQRRRSHQRAQRNRGLAQQPGAVGLAAGRTIARQRLNGGHRLGPRLGHAGKCAAGQPPPAHAGVVVPTVELREQLGKRVAQPFGRAPHYPKVQRHLVQGQAGAGSGQRERQAEQTLGRFVAHGHGGRPLRWCRRGMAREYVRYGRGSPPTSRRYPGSACRPDSRTRARWTSTIAMVSRSQ